MVRGLAFTLLVPGVVGAWIPGLLRDGDSARGGLWSVGWLVVGSGAIVYGLCLLGFLMAGGTPAIFFTRPLKFVLGEEPPTLVRRGLYRISRNPMYIGVLLVVLGQAIVFASLGIALYCTALGLIFHLVVVFIEEPHLRKERGPSYDDYCRQVPRWLG